MLRAQSVVDRTSRSPSFQLWFRLVRICSRADSIVAATFAASRLRLAPRSAVALTSSSSDRPVAPGMFLPDRCARVALTWLKSFSTFMVYPLWFDGLVKAIHATAVLLPTDVLR